MKLCLLHLDDALTRQREFVEECHARKARQLHAADVGEHVRLWGKDRRLAPLADNLRETFFAGNDDDPKLCFMGSGDFHHVTALLLSATLEKCNGPITVIHFDNHPDWVHYRGGMHCGSWVNSAAGQDKVAKVITIGVCSHDLQRPDKKGANLDLLSGGRLELFPYDHAPSKVSGDYGAGGSFRQIGSHLHWQTIARTGEEAFTEKLLSRIPTGDVYITVDKDVLSREDCETNWDQGVMRLPYLLLLLRAIGKKHRIIGADVTGDYSRPRYGGNIWTRSIKHLEIYADQPRQQPSEEMAANLNSASNQAILGVFSEVMA